MTLNIVSAPFEADNQNPRLTSLAFKRGLKCRCPNCGEGRLFSSFSKSVAACDHCGEELHHHRADDFPAYLVIFIVGHLVVAGYMATDMVVNWNSWQHMALWLPITLILSIALLQPLKGAVIGLQWAWRMHGFSGQPTHPGDL